MYVAKKADKSAPMINKKIVQIIKKSESVIKSKKVFFIDFILISDENFVSWKYCEKKDRDDEFDQLSKTFQEEIFKDLSDFTKILLPPIIERIKQDLRL